MVRGRLFNRIRAALFRRYLLIQLGIDLTAWTVGLTVAMGLRFESADPADWGPSGLRGLVAIIIVAGLLQIATGIGSGLYRGHWRFGSLDEVTHLTGAVVATTTIVFVLNQWVFGRSVPASTPLVGGILAMALMAAARFTWRLYDERRLRPSSEHAQRVIVFGAGEGGEQVATAMLRSPDSPYLPIAFLDDDEAKRRLRIRGVPVLGGRDELERVARKTEATLLVIAIPSASSDLIRDLYHAARDAGLEVKLLPPLDELLGGTVGVADLRPPTEADLLGRHEVTTDLEKISGYLTGRRVLVTGAGGSIGSELCHQITRFAPESLVMLDRDESGLHATQLRISGRAMLDSRDLVVADIRDREALATVFAEHRPHVVFHTAALKHLPLLEQYPNEALKTNVYGTENLLELAAEYGVERLVNISTDKAADPTSVLGYTKRIAERLTAQAAATTPGTFLSVRFGNVLGSRGSVLTAFRAQIDAGGPITVTHPDVTRYFMTIEEAVQLVVQAGAVGNDGEALVLDMGSPVRIDDVARQLAEQAERPIDIVYTGLRPGEKMHEVLFSTAEGDERPAHPLISHVCVPALTLAAVHESCDGTHTTDELIAILRDLAVGAADATV